MWIDAESDADSDTDTHDKDNENANIPLIPQGPFTGVKSAGTSSMHADAKGVRRTRRGSMVVSAAAAAAGV
jgi:hypothetical protein